MNCKHCESLKNLICKKGAGCFMNDVFSFSVGMCGFLVKFGFCLWDLLLFCYTFWQGVCCLDVSIM